MRRSEHASLDTLPTAAREVIEVERWIAARPETVFSYFTDPERFARWQGEAASIEFLEMVAPRRLVFTWGWKGIPFMDEDTAALLSRPSTVEISLESKGDGTLLRLRQTGAAG